MLVFSKGKSLEFQNVQNQGTGLLVLQRRNCENSFSITQVTVLAKALFGPNRIQNISGFNRRGKFENPSDPIKQLRRVVSWDLSRVHHSRALNNFIVSFIPCMLPIPVQASMFVVCYSYVVIANLSNEQVDVPKVKNNNRELILLALSGFTQQVHTTRVKYQRSLILYKSEVISL